MNSITKEKIAVCYSCSGESYRKSALRRITEDYFDDDNIYYFIITDDKSYFKDIKRKNLFVNEVKDFYSEFPLVEKYEALLEAADKNDYAKKFVDTRYRFSFSLMRFHFYQALQYGISNVFLMCTDTKINFDIFNDSFFDNKNTIYNAVSEWNSDAFECGQEVNMHIVRNYLKDKYGFETPQHIRILDAAGRFFVLDSIETTKKFFDLWNDVISYLYESDQMFGFEGAYVYHDEYILAPIYHVFGLNKRHEHSTSRIFDVKHNQIEERFWSLAGSNPGIVEHYNYEEFLKMNNLENNG